jgi:hypothetical protein
MNWETIEKMSSLLGIIGSVASVFAYIQAKGAKKAAVEARKEIYLRSTQEEIDSICRECSLKESIKWLDANDMIANTTGRVKGILGQYNSNNDYQKIITEISNSLDVVDTAFNSLNPEAKNDEILNILAGPFRKLISKLQEFNGRLREKVISQ